jgi:hypothetical protein
LALNAGASSAQAVRGHLIDAVDRGPIPYAYVTLLDNAEAPVAQALADREGAFEIRAPGEGTYSVRVERMGIRAFVSAPFLVTVDSTPLREFRLSVEAIELSGIDAAVSRRCAGDPDRIYAGRTLWEEVRRTHFTAPPPTQVGPIRYEVREYSRVYDGTRTGFFRADTLTRTLHEDPYKSLPIDSLLAFGFVQPAPNGQGWAYFGPDVDVLLADTFLDAYCFSTSTEEGEEDRVGLSFEPASPEFAPGIAGIVWLDRATFNLKSVEFTFTRYPHRVAGVAGGGEIRFQRLSGGGYIVIHWRLLAPDIIESVRANRLGLRGYREIERAVTAAFLADGTPIPVGGVPAPR